MSEEVQMTEQEVRELATKYAGKWIKVNEDAIRSRSNPPNAIDQQVIEAGKIKVIGFCKVYSRWRIVCYVGEGIGTHYKELADAMVKVNLTALDAEDYNVHLIGIKAEDLCFEPLEPSKSKFPHTCYCGSPCFMMFQSTECSNAKCCHYKDIR